MWRRMEIFSEKSKIGPKAYNTGYSQVVTQPSTDAVQQDLTLVIGREPFFLCLKQTPRSPIY